MAKSCYSDAMRGNSVKGIGIKTKTIALCVGIALMTTALSGCAASEPVGAGTENVAAKEELVLAVGGEPTDGGFDPTQGWGRYGSPLFQSTLLARNDKLEIINDLATGYTVSDDTLTYTVKLRPAKFSNGTPLTADDVVFTYQTAGKSGSVVDLTMMESVKAVDASTVEFKLKHPSSVFLYRLAELGIVPKATYSADYLNNPVGSGPYQMVQWDKGQQLIVEANPEYYGTKPAFKKITFLFLAEDAAFAAAKAGQVDMAAIPSAFASQKVDGMNVVAVDSVDNRGVGFPMVPAQGEKTEDGYAIGNDVTSDKAIRLAVNYAMDRQALVDGPLYGYGTPAFSPTDGLPWGSTDVNITDADTAAAEKYLADGGWRDTNGDGVLEKGEVRAAFSLLYPADDSLRQALALAVADQMKPLGIEIEVLGKSWDEITPLMHSNAVLWGWGSHDPTEVDQMYNSKWAGVQYNNAGFYSNATVDSNLNAAMGAKTEAEAILFWQNAAWDGTTGYTTKGDAVYAWLVNIDHVYLVSDKLDIGQQRVQPHGHGWPVTANITSWKSSGQ
jgi:peptide/nickel transport system substrate-binding protein